MNLPLIFKNKIKEIIPLNYNWIRYLYYARFRNWTIERKNEGMVFSNRYQLYEYINKAILNNNAIDFLEFGVYKGESIKYWAKTNTHASSRFWGFDTFSGLPEPWREGDMVAHVKGAFNADGKVPVTDDGRIDFVEGLFQDTLDSFLQAYKLSGNLIIHNDSDLYSSSLYLLTKCDILYKPGTIIIFDELSSWMNEFKALDEYCIAYNREYKILGRTEKFVEVAIILL